MNFGAKLKLLRKKKKLSQEKLGNEVGISGGDISHYETGLRLPKMPALIKLCVGLGCTPNDLIDIPNQKYD